MQTNDEELKETLYKYLKSKGYTRVVRNDYFIFAEGDLPLCLLAHIDTVFQFLPSEFYYDNRKKVMWSPDGLGADDRAGVYAIITLIEKGYKPSIIFTDLEECGGQGAAHLVKLFPVCPFRNCKALIQLDRRGSKDSVFYQCENKSFETLINSYGFITAWGTFTDISIIAPKWKIAAVNLSIGYYHEHQNIEFINMIECHDTIDKVEKMLQDCLKWKKYKYIPARYTVTKYGNFFSNSFTLKDSPWWLTNTCAMCDKKLADNEGRLVDDGMNSTDGYLLCDSCYEKYLKQYLV